MMAASGPGKGGGKGGPVKNLKKRMRKDDDDGDFEDLEQEKEEMIQDKPTHKQTTPLMYSMIKMGEFVMKSMDRKLRLDDRKKQIEEAAQKEQEDDDDDEDDEETEKDKLERKTRELESQLKKAERAEALARDKEEKKKATEFSKWIQRGKFLKQPQAVTLVKTGKKKKVLKTEAIKSVDEEDKEDKILEGLQQESPHCLNMKRAENFQAYL